MKGSAVRFRASAPQNPSMRSPHAGGLFCHPEPRHEEAAGWRSWSNAQRPTSVSDRVAGVDGPRRKTAPRPEPRGRATGGAGTERRGRCPLLAPSAGTPRQRYAPRAADDCPVSRSSHLVLHRLAAAQPTRALRFVLPSKGWRLPGGHDPALASPRRPPEAQAVEGVHRSPVSLRPRRPAFRQHLESAVGRAPLVPHGPALRRLDRVLPQLRQARPARRMCGRDHTPRATSES